MLAARVACVAEGTRWLPESARAVYRADFADDRDIADAGVIDEILGSVGQDGSELLAAPTFEVAGELFWGHDRLPDALAWYKAGAVAGE